MLKIGQERFLETSWKRLWRVLGRLRVVSVRFRACWSVLAVSGSLWVASWGVLGRYHRPWEGLRGLQNTSKKWDPFGIRRSLAEGGGYPIGPAPFLCPWVRSILEGFGATFQHIFVNSGGLS